jgi:hypothetical protein
VRKSGPRLAPANVGAVFYLLAITVYRVSATKPQLRSVTDDVPFADNHGNSFN